MDRWIFGLTFLAAIGAGLIAGVFVAFSTFVMKALRRLPAAEGMAAMQAINIVVINPIFLGVFLGTAALCLAAIAAGALRWDRPGAVYPVGGGILYFAGTFLVTMLCNVPLNNALARVKPDDPDAERQWADYVTRWTAWNHIRTAAALAGMILFILTLSRP